MKGILILLGCIIITGVSVAQENGSIRLPERSADRGTTVMKALENRQSSRSYSSSDLDIRDLSDLLWAAKGVNRENGKLTSPTAQNSQDVDVYVAMVNGVYLYNAKEHTIVKVCDEDIRPMIEGRRPTGAPVCVLITADMSRYGGYRPDGDNTHFYEMGAVDAGIVSQNISLFCAAVDLATVPRAGMDQQGIREALQLPETVLIWLNHPVGYHGEE